MGGERVLTAMAGFAARRPWSILGTALVVVALSVGLASRGLELRTSNLDLIDPDLPQVRAFLDVGREFGTPNLLVVVLESDDEQRLPAAVDRLRRELRNAPGVRGVVDGLPLDRETLEELGLERYIVSHDRTMYFVFVQPDDPRSSAQTIEPFVAGVREALGRCRLEELGVRAGLTGMPEYALNDRDVIRHDISRLSLVSFVLVLSLFAWGFRAICRPLLAMAALGVGVIAALGIVAVYPGHLTLLSAFFASILFGLGSDFGIHVVHRVEEVVGEGAGEAEAIAPAVRTIGGGLLTGALTTSAVFFAMRWSGFLGFAELGFVAGTGVLVCLLAMVSVLPALLVVTGRRSAPGPRVPRRESRLGKLLWRIQRPSLAATVVAAAVASAFYGGPGFDTNYLDLQPVDSEAARLERAMVEGSDLSPSSAIFVVDDAERARRLTDRLLADDSVGDVHSIADLDLLPDDAALRGRIPASFRAGFESDSGRYAVYAYPAGDIWDPEFRSLFLERMRAVDPEVTGMPVLGDFMMARSRRAMAIVATVGAALLLVLVGLGFRSWRATALALMPTLLTVLAMQALMKLLGIRFNPLNVMALPVVLGVAVDDGIHLVHRFLVERGDLRRTLEGTGRSVVLTSATTLAAFGSLAFTSHRGLASFAQALCLGVASALVFSILALPAALRLAYRGGVDSGRVGAGDPARRDPSPVQELHDARAAIASGVASAGSEGPGSVSGRAAPRSPRPSKP